MTTLGEILDLIDNSRESEKMPSVKPQYTEAEIQKIQELEQAQLEKAYEIGKAEQQKTGHWKKAHDDIMQWWACSECGKPCPKATYGGDFFSDYCPNCGAKMEESEE